MDSVNADAERVRMYVDNDLDGSMRPSRVREGEGRRGVR